MLERAIQNSAPCQDRGWLLVYLRMDDHVPCGPLLPIKKLTRKSMPEPDWMARTIGSAEYEFAALQGDRLGLIACFDWETAHRPRRRLRRRQNREQVGCNRHSRQGLWH